MEFRLFGGVEADVDGHRIDLGSTRQRCLLAVLLVEANTPVTVDQLTERIWSRPPRHARASVQSYVSRLRRVLVVPIDRQGDGYLLAVDERTVDLHRFRHLAAAGDQALASLAEALRLSDVEPFTGMDTPWLNDIRATVLAERDAVLLEYNDVRLRHGDHHELLAGLCAQAERRPLDERLAEQLMVALYRSGRQADAVAVYRDTRTRLAEELGIHPAAALNEVYQRILVADPSLTPGGPPAAPGPLEAVMAGTDGTTLTIVAITGPPGTGKTRLALHWAQQHRLPDGQLFADLHGSDPSGPSARSSVLRGFLVALGVEPPTEPDAQIGLYRSLTAERRLLVVLDDAVDTAQVTPLLPSGASCVVLVTSRDRLTGLVAAHGAHPLPLGS